MTLTQYQTHHNLTNAAMCRLINAAKAAEEDPVFEARLAKLKDGNARAKGYETRALMVATEDEADSYR